MKILMSLLFVISFSQSLLAANSTITLSESDVAIAPVDALSIELVSQEPLCPDGLTCFVDGTIVNIDVGFIGCSDRLGPLYYYAQEDAENGILNLYIGASIIRNKKSMVEFCTKPLTSLTTITLIAKYGKVKIHQLAGL